MTREEELKGLESVCSFLGSMSDDERFEYLMKNSKSFKKEMSENTGGKYGKEQRVVN